MRPTGPAPAPAGDGRGAHVQWRNGPPGQRLPQHERDCAGGPDRVMNDIITVSKNSKP